MLFELGSGPYLNYVSSWVDPNPAPVIEEHDGAFVVRDDLLGVGSKVRFIDYLIKTTDCDEWVFGGANPIGWGPISLTHVCNRYGKRATFFMAARKEPTPVQQRVLDMGGTINWLKMGMLNVTLARAKQYHDEDPSHRRILPLGLNHPTVIGSIIKVARSLTLPPISQIWCVASSGTLARGLQLAFPEIPAIIVQTGHKMNQDEIGRAIAFVSPYKFDKPVKPQDAPPYPSVPEYDAKLWPFYKQYGKKDALIWNVA